MMNYPTENVDRRNMWIRILGPSSSKLDRANYAKKLGFKNANEVKPIAEDITPVSTISTLDMSSFISYSSPFVSLGNCSDACCPAPCAQEAKDNTTKGNKPMRYYDEHNDEYVDSSMIASKSDLAQARSYLESRLDDAARTKRSEELRKAFYMDDDEAPATAKQMVERITAGKFILPTDKEEAEYLKYYSFYGSAPFKTIKWRDPSKPADTAGYAAAVAKVHETEGDTLDVIKTGTEKEGLEALKAFKSTTFH